MKFMRISATLVILGAMATGLAGCEFANENRMVTGAVAGAVIGGVAGALVSDDTTKGVLIGSAAGAALGGGIGYLLDRQKDSFDEIEDAQVETTTVTVVDSDPAPKATPDGTLTAATEDPGPAGAPVTKEALTVTMKSEVLFAGGSADLSPRGVENVKEVSGVLKEYPDSDVIVRGYTASNGEAAANQQLSKARAETVKGHLVANGIASARVQTVGMGETDPVADNSTEYGRIRNHRVEIDVIPRDQAG